MTDVLKEDLQAVQNNPGDLDEPAKVVDADELVMPGDIREVQTGNPSMLARLKSRFSGNGPAVTVALTGESLTVEKRKGHTIPVRILMGFLPDVTEKDARNYALGVAEKHFEQPGMAFFDAFKYSTGFAYEVHEGGGGHAYLPEIIKYFDEQGAYEAMEDVKVILSTGTRMVEVQRTRHGLSAILLPESSKLEPSDFLVPHKKLSPALNQRTGLLIAGAVFFITGFFALIVGSLLTRYQAYEEPLTPVVSRVNYEDLPIAQWSRIEALPPNSYVAKLMFENKKWVRDIRNEAVQGVPSAGAPIPPPPSRGIPVPAIPAPPVPPVK